LLELAFNDQKKEVPMSRRLTQYVCATALAALIVLPVQALATSTTIDLESDSNTLAYSTGTTAPGTPGVNGTIPLTSWVPVDVGSYGTFTSVPPGAPSGSGAEVVNIPTPSGDESSGYTGNNGFFLVEFTLPADFTTATLTIAANVDDNGYAFLNGTQFGSQFTEFGNVSSTVSTGFVVGTNWLVISDDNSGGGPSGAGFYGTVTYEEPNSAVPEPHTFLFLGLALAGIALMGRTRAKA